jgi:hypothetical protein
MFGACGYDGGVWCWQSIIVNGCYYCCVGLTIVIVKYVGLNGS